MIEKARIFIYDAGKVISTDQFAVVGIKPFWPTGKNGGCQRTICEMTKARPDKAAELERQKNAALLQTSLQGQLGKAIEPAIAHWDMTGRLVRR